MRKFFLINVILIFAIACTSDVLPKPKAQLRLAYAPAQYHKVASSCPYTIAVSQESNIIFESDCDANVYYPKLNATLHLTYRTVDNNLNTILQEIEKLTYEHAVKADAINAQPYENVYTKVYGKIVNVEGNVASNIQFYATDSIKNVLYGTLYFNIKPNYDSILPALNYVEKDIRNLVESIEWKE